MVLPGEIRAMMRLSFPSRAHQVVDPVILEMELMRVEAFRLGYDFDLLVVVRSASIGGDDSPFEVGVHEVGATVVLDGLLLLPLGTLLALGDGCAVELLQRRGLEGR